MAMNLNDFLGKHPVDRREVDAHKARMLEETRACQLRECTDLPQAQGDEGID